MERDSYIDGIRSAWLGELFGQAFFSALALVQHEQALLTFTERQLNGDSTHALQDVETLLAQEENL